MNRTLKKMNLIVLTLITVLCAMAALTGIMRANAAEENTAADALSSVTVADKSVRMEMIDGAYVRSEQPVGIRFMTYLALEDYNALVAEYGAEGFELGTELTAAGQTGSITAEKATMVGEDIIRFAAVVTDIPEEMYGEQITAKSYISVSGEKAYTQNSVTRSISEVAAAALAEPLQFTNAERVILEGFAGVTDLTADPVALDMAFVTDFNASLGEAAGVTVNHAFDASLVNEETSVQFEGIVGQKNLTVYTDEGIKLMAVNMTTSDPFDSSNAEGWQASSGLISVYYAEGEGALAIKMGNVSNDINTRHQVVYYDIAPLKSAVEKGYNHLSIQVKATSEFLSCLPTYLPGIRVYGKVNAGLDEVSIIDGNAGVYVMRDIRDSALTADTYVTVVINLKTVLDAHSDVNYLGLCANGANGGVIYIKGGVFLNDYVDPDPPETDVQVNIFGLDTAWKVSSNFIAYSYDAAEQGMKITMANINSDINGRHFVAYTSIAPLKAAAENGYGYLTFEVKASAGYLDCDPYLPGVRIFGKVNDGLDEVAIAEGSEGIYVIQDLREDALTADTYITVTIDIATVLEAHPDINYFGLCMNGANSFGIWFRNGEFLTELPE